MTDTVVENFRPLKNQVLFRKHKQPETSSSGVILNIYNDDHPNFGDIIAVGPDVNIVKAGDVVIFNHYGGNRVTFKGEELFFMHENEILAVVENGDAVL